LPQEFRDELLDWYLECLSNYTKVEREHFLRFFYPFCFARFMQTLGVYGREGLSSDKVYFRSSIAFAIDNLKRLMHKFGLPVRVPHLALVLDRLVTSPWATSNGTEKAPLHVEIGSFSFKSGLPEIKDATEGGFIFDCRSLPNPGRNAQYSPLTGRDEPIREFLGQAPEVSKFLVRIQEIVVGAVAVHQDRGFPNMAIHFGCTGGRHRSVFSAEYLAEQLRKIPGVEVRVVHRDLLGSDKEFAKREHS
jgi:hypothetical protein